MKPNNYFSDKINPIFIPKVQAKTYLKSVEAAIGFEDEILGVLQGINVAILDNEVAQVLCLWGEAIETWKLRAQAEGRSSFLGPHTAPRIQGQVAPS